MQELDLVVVAVKEELEVVLGRLGFACRGVMLPAIQFHAEGVPEWPP